MLTLWCFLSFSFRSFSLSFPSSPLSPSPSLSSLSPLSSPPFSPSPSFSPVGEVGESLEKEGAEEVIGEEGGEGERPEKKTSEFEGLSVLVRVVAVLVVIVVVAIMVVVRVGVGSVGPLGVIVDDRDGGVIVFIAFGRSLPLEVGVLRLVGVVVDGSTKEGESPGGERAVFGEGGRVGGAVGGSS